MNCMLEELEFPSSLEYVGDQAFDNCPNFSNGNYRNTKVRYIGKQPYEYIAVDVYLPKTISLASLTDYRWYTELSIDEKHPYIKKDDCGYFFSNGTILGSKTLKKHVLLRQGTEIISPFCFYALNIVHITIPASVIEISQYSFYDCWKLKTIIFQKNSRLIEIGEKAFGQCDGIKSMKFPKSLKILRSNAFIDCFNLKHVEFSEDSQLERIEAAFPFTSIKHLYLPPSIKVIDFLIYKLRSLESLYINNDVYKSNKDRNAILSKDGSELICVISTAENFEIPDGI